MVKFYYDYINLLDEENKELYMDWYEEKGEELLNNINEENITSKLKKRYEILMKCCVLENNYEGLLNLLISMPKEIINKNKVIKADIPKKSGEDITLKTKKLYKQIKSITY